MTTQVSKKTDAVLLLNLGGPDSLKAIRPFLKNLFLDKSIIKLPLQPFLARVIAFFRTRKVKVRYAAIGGKSPLLELTQAQAFALEKQLQADGLPVKVFVGMRYWHPFISETIKEIISQGFNRLVVLPLFPQYSQATTGSCLAEVKKALSNYKDKVEVYIIKEWPKQPEYIQSLAKKIQAALTAFPEKQRDMVEVVFTAHSLPEEFVKQGDPYVKQIEETVGECLKLLKINNWQIAFQSRSGPVRWLEPATDKLITKLAQEGSKYLLLVPISFVSDHIETLYEIDIMFKEQAVNEGFLQVERSAALNGDELFIKGLAALVKEKLIAAKKEEVGL